MKIHILYDFLKEFGGLERVMFFQARELADDHTVKLLFSFIDRSRADEIVASLGQKKKITIEQIRSGHHELMEYLYSLLMPRRIVSVDSDLLISHSFMSTRMASYLYRKKNIPYFVMIHHPPNFLYDRSLAWVNNIPRFFAYLAGFLLGPLLRASDRQAVRGARLVFANSNYTARRIHDIYGIRSVVLYPSLDPAFTLLPARVVQKRLAVLNVHSPYILLHGRMIRDKRPDWALRAFARISDRVPHSLVISGTLEEKESMVRLIHDLNLEKRVQLLGRVSEEALVALYNGADCFLMSAPHEDFGLTPIEAMGCGCPVVAWKDGAGPEESIIPERTGILARPYDLADYAHALEKALGQRWNRKAISHSMKKYSQEKISKEFLSFIKNSASL